MAGIDILFLSKEDVDTLELSLPEVMDAVEMGLQAHGEKKVIMPSKDHLALDYRKSSSTSSKATSNR